VPVHTQGRAPVRDTKKCVILGQQWAACSCIALKFQILKLQTAAPSYFPGSDISDLRYLRFQIARSVYCPPLGDTGTLRV
jgi:hypothetical protein